jgi:hypothetical protein
VPGCLDRAPHSLDFRFLLLGRCGRGVAGFYALRFLHCRLELVRSHQRNGLILGRVAGRSDRQADRLFRYGIGDLPSAVDYRSPRTRGDHYPLATITPTMVAIFLSAW